MYHYRKCMPRANKILEEKWVKHCQDLHRKKLKEMRSYVDTTAPTTTRLSHLSENLKKQQLDEERYSQIERENYLLLDKMSYIMTHPQLLDEKYMGAPVSYGKSLNKEFRKRELMRITEENQQILRRIQQKEPHYSHLEWEEKVIACCDASFCHHCLSLLFRLVGTTNTSATVRNIPICLPPATHLCPRPQPALLVSPLCRRARRARAARPPRSVTHESRPRRTGVSTRAPGRSAALLILQ
mmetsp:Transcript_2561/g.7049  ORF Transcript_2561/g.7049 Transcript_2561/m.7049 type:complete len:241 (+) Transcript_2561:83-805(+)